MYPASDSEWMGYKLAPIEEPRAVGNVSRSWQWREMGIDPPNSTPNKRVLENIAEDILVRKPLVVRSCDLPGYPRSTFLMVFSPDGTKVASTHGNHNVYVSELASGKHVRILKGHPRTPWCIAFHPSHPQLIGSGCLGGQVRVWDIASGGSEVWNVRNETVVASIAFHPREQLLVIATYNELYFWDWSQPAPFTKVSTNNINEKVRYVAFDSLGYKLITGISLWACQVTSSNNPLLTQNLIAAGTNSSSSSSGNNSNNNSNGRGDNNDDNQGPPPESPRAAQDMIVNSYQTLVQRYDSLVRNYQRLFMVRHRLTNTPPTPNTIDRGTDPMETYPMDHGRRRRSSRRSSRATGHSDSLNSSPSTSRRHDGADSGEGESSSRLLNLDVLSFDSDASRTQDSPNQERTTFGSSLSAFQPLLDLRSFRSNDSNERTTRLLPNPFSSTSSPRQNRASDQPSTSNNPNSSRTSIFAPSRAEYFGRDTALRRRNVSATQSTSTSSEAPPAGGEQPAAAAAEPQPSTSRAAPTTNSATQMSPEGDAQSINESLDLIRDILRDSGTRLLNLITNMSMNILSSSRRLDRPARPHLARLFTGDLRRDFLPSSSDSDSDNTELSILRTPNFNYLDNIDSGEDEPATAATAAAGSSSTASTAAAPSRAAADAPTDRMEFELRAAPAGSGAADAPRGRFRVRTQSTSALDERGAREPQPGPSTARPRTPLAFDPDVPSTSRDAFWARGPSMSAEEAFRKVRTGVSTLQKHTFELANMWLRGDRATMRHLRTMWENLRRRILALQRETGRQDSPGYYTRSLLERCMILTEMTDIASRQTAGRGARPAARADDPERGGPAPPPAGGSAPASQPSTSAEPRAARAPRPARLPRSALGSRNSIFQSPYLRRPLQPNIRWRVEDEFRRRRHPASRLLPRHGRARCREFARAIEVSATRHEIRMRAMQVLSIMFNMMMMCLEERGLSQLIINMLKTLKKALALTCFMMVSNRSGARGAAAGSLDVVRIQPAEHAGPVIVDGPASPSPAPPPPPAAAAPERPHSLPRASTSRATSMDQDTPVDEFPSPSPNVASQRWSHRLAVQISAANRNTSSTARTRRDLYLETRKQKALHRTNPTAHPLIRKRIPPVSSHRIPVLRNVPSRSSTLSKTPRLLPPSRADEPVAGPSHAPPAPARDPEEGFVASHSADQFLRIAHMHALRMRNSARNRFRRLQAIRLYTPSSVREIFALHPQNNNEQGGRADSRASPPGGSPRRAGAEPARPAEPELHAMLNNVAIPIVPVNADGLPAPGEAQPNSPRLPRIHEYLQPIILAQNAMVVEGEEGEGGARRLGGMAGLFDAGIISEAMPAPAHRVQAWDFTGGAAPDISDNTKNVVVQRCRIHNDASIDISKDGKLLVALLPVPRLRNTNKCLGVYSLEWARLGQCLHTAALEQSAVSVALSPSARYLAVGLGSRRFTSAPHNRNNIIALLYKLDSVVAENTNRSGLLPIKELEQHWEHGFTSLNCLRWAPQPGQGLVYANNTGQLIIMS